MTTTAPAQPLAGKRILITRSAEQAGEFVAMLEKRGARVLACPTIKLLPVDDWQEIDAAIYRLPQTDWLILTSANGVNFFFQRLQQLGLGNAQLASCKLCVVGPKTAQALEKYGLRADLVPAEYTAEGVVAAFQGINLQGKQVLFPRADKARDIIPPALREKGATVNAPVLYCNMLPDKLPEAALQALEQHTLDIAVFSASSTVKNLATLLGGAKRLQELLTGVLVASIGPITTRTCQELGIKVDIEPTDATLEALMQELENAFTRSRPTNP